MKIRIVASLLCFFLSFSALMAQDFILTEGYAQLDHGFVKKYNLNKQKEVRLDPVLRDKLMPFYVEVIKREAVMLELHIGTVKSADGTITPLDTAIYEYDKDGKLLTLTVNSKNSAGVYQPSSLNFKYNKSGKLTEITAGKKSVLKLTRDKKGNITKANNTSYTYKKGKLDKFGSMKWDGNYMVDKKKGNGAQDPGHTVMYEENGRPWQGDWEESRAVYAYDTKSRLVVRSWEGEGLKEEFKIGYKNGLMDEITEASGTSPEDKPDQLIKVQVIKIYRDGK